MRDKIESIALEYSLTDAEASQLTDQLMDLFSVNKRNLIKSILEDIEDVYPEYHRECIEGYLDGGC